MPVKAMVVVASMVAVDIKVRYHSRFVVRVGHETTCQSSGNGILLPKLFWPTVRKNWSSDWETLLKFEAEGREFAKILSERSEQFLVTECFFNLFLEVSQIKKNRTILI